MDEVKLGKYQHYKGNFYSVIGIATDSETKEEMVVYLSLKNNQLWVRPKGMFLENVVVDGKEVPRFLYVGEK